jgi:hypothetical protein
LRQALNEKIFPSRNPDDRALIVSLNENSCILYDSSQSDDYNSANGSNGYNKRRLIKENKLSKLNPDLAIMLGNSNFKVNDGIDEMVFNSEGGLPTYMPMVQRVLNSTNIKAFYPIYSNNTTLRNITDSHSRYGAMFNISKKIVKTADQMYAESML